MKFLVCPVCGSTDIYYEAGMIEGQKYRCNNCGYVGSFVMEMDENEYIEFMKRKSQH
ncbi:MAG: hypothetical protein ACP5G5_04640 [Thermoplasmata archaeon]|jgi:transposase-like protein